MDLKYCILPYYSTCPYKLTVKQFRSQCWCNTNEYPQGHNICFYKENEKKIYKNIA